MHRAHRVHEARAILRAADARSDLPTTCDTWLVLGVADTITRHPVLSVDRVPTRLGLSKRVDQQTRSGHPSSVSSMAIASWRSLVTANGQ